MSLVLFRGFGVFFFPLSVLNIVFVLFFVFLFFIFSSLFCFSFLGGGGGGGGGEWGGFCFHLKMAVIERAICTRTLFSIESAHP